MMPNDVSVGVVGCRMHTSIMFNSQQNKNGNKKQGCPTMTLFCDNVCWSDRLFAGMKIKKKTI